MNKTGKRFVALFVVFLSMVSFLPIPFGENGQAANAAGVQNTNVSVSGPTNLNSTDPVTQSNGNYVTKNIYPYFNITVDDKTVLEDTIRIGGSGIINQRIIITKIDGIDIDGSTISKAKLAEIACTISDGNLKLEKGRGVTISNLPLGANNIEYRIEETTVAKVPKTDPATGKPSTTDFDRKETKATFPSDTETRTVTILHGNEYVQNMIGSLDFDSYIGTKTQYQQNLEADQNKTPFLFTARAKVDKSNPLSYTFDVPDGTKVLDYIMNFNDMIITNAKIYKNGEKDSSISALGSQIKGSLSNLTQKDMILLRIDGMDANSQVISKSYSIEINYNALGAKNDYTLRKAGITKFIRNEDPTVKAYVGKHFIAENDTSIPTYNGEIYVDKKAGMISLEPVLGRDTSTIAYVVTNHHDGTYETSTFKNGKQYINFQASPNDDNVIWIQVRNGKDGNVTNDTDLAIYKLKVKFVGDGSSSNVDFSFTGENAYLTQPGRGQAGKMDFTQSRRSYDLYCADKVTVKLETPTGAYFRAWLGDNLDSDVGEEVDPNSASSSNERVITVGSHKKLILQAYYYNSADQKAYPIGDKYVFYIAKNITTNNNNNGNQPTNDATLSNLTISNGTLIASDGSSGFSSSNSSYKVTVAKRDTTSKIVATANSSNVKSITATVIETTDDYELTSGASSEIPLNAKGKTTLKIVVTAADGTTTKTYNLTITNDPRGASSKLKNLIITPGDYNFDPTQDTTKVRVDTKVTSVKITPVLEETKARVIVNGTTFAGSPVSVSIKGSQKTEITIDITSEDGTSTKTYTIVIYRTDSDLPSDDNNDDTEDVFYDDINDCWVDTSKYEEWGTINGKPVYFDNKGRQVKNRWVLEKGNYSYVGTSGFRVTGWRTENDGKSYYLDPSTGYMKKEWLNLNGNWYYMGLNGSMRKGWAYIGKKWYYFLPDNGKLVMNQKMYIGGKVYRFRTDGSMY